MKLLTALISTAALVGCVSGAPYLTSEQYRQAGKIEVYKVGTTPNKEFKAVAAVEAADCSGPGGTRLYGDEGKAIDTLKMKVVAIGGDALVNVSCQSVPLLNNCWAAKKCDGNAVIWK